MTDSKPVCEHKYIHLRNHSYKKESGYRGWNFVSVDIFFCEKCLDQKETKKEHFSNQCDYDTRPDWCKTITNKIYE